ncbi:MAG: transporter [Gemmatimonadaceae bacterium]|nr:transporter [Gemmatimonadaceae bacterium]
MRTVLASSPLLLLFLIAAIGYPLGRLRLGRTQLGVSAVLFTGLAFGAADPALRLPDTVAQLGLVLFVYTVGLASGPAFFDALRRKGLGTAALVAGLLLGAASLTVLLGRWLGLSAGLTAGLFTGALTNTPALAAVLDYLAHAAGGAPDLATGEAPVVGYSIAYPGGVLGMIAAIAVAQRLWRVDYAAEARALRALGATAVPLVSRTLRVTRAGPDGRSLADDARVPPVRLARLQRGARITVPIPGERLRDGDLVSVVGTAEDLEALAAMLGEPVAGALADDRTVLDFRRIFVSHPRVLARRLGDLLMEVRFGATVTRVRRGDQDFLASDETILQPGDRLRVVAPRKRLAEVAEFLGDSYRHLSEVDILTFSLGLVAGLALGLLPIPLPGDGAFRLGVAGGPLLVALLLSALDRTGPLVWNLPYGANLTLRQFGLVLFLAAIGTRAGGAFLGTLTSRGGLALLGAGAAITLATALATLWIGHRILRVPLSLLSGMLAGLQTNPAVLGFASEQSRSDVPTIGYATVYPLATVLKILLAQLIVALLT